MSRVEGSTSLPRIPTSPTSLATVAVLVALIDRLGVGSAVKRVVFIVFHSQLVLLPNDPSNGECSNAPPVDELGPRAIWSVWVEQITPQSFYHLFWGELY